MFKIKTRFITAAVAVTAMGLTSLGMVAAQADSGLNDSGFTIKAVNTVHGQHATRGLAFVSNKTTDPPVIGIEDPDVQLWNVHDNDLREQIRAMLEIDETEPLTMDEAPLLTNAIVANATNQATTSGNRNVEVTGFDWSVVRTAEGLQHATNLTELDQIGLPFNPSQGYELPNTLETTDGLDNITKIGTWSGDRSDLEEFTMPALREVTQQIRFAHMDKLTKIDLSKLTRINQFVMADSPLATDVSLENVETADLIHFSTATNLDEIVMDKLTTVRSLNFGVNSIERISLASLNGTIGYLSGEFSNVQEFNTPITNSTSTMITCHGVTYWSFADFKTHFNQAH